MRWIKSEIDQDLVRSMSRSYGVDLLTASILARRKVTEPEQVLYFLENDLRHLHNPFLFHAMEDAVDRILLAAEETEKVLVFGDSDTDGVTATTLMVEALAEVGLKASFRVPRGEEPYGLSLAAVEDFAAEGGSLIITVDCGISNHEEVQKAAELGIDVILCDHHRLQTGKAPDALAVIDPKVEGCGYPFRDLAGAGVAFKMAMALRFARTGLYKQSVALLSIRATETKGETASKKYEIQALRLHNLVPAGSFSEFLEPGSVRRGEVLERLAAFLVGRSLFVYDDAQTKRDFTLVFGGNVDLETYDIQPDITAIFPELTGSNLAMLGKELHIGRYSSEPEREMGVLEELFSILARKKAGAFGADSGDFLQLAALGSIADLMPLRDENRIIVKRGVEALASSPRKGIKELLKALGLGRSLSATDVAWQITPLLNAAGRIGSPEIALRLLMSEDQAERNLAVEEIQKANGERKKMSAEVWEVVYPLAGEMFQKTQGRYILVGSPLVKSGITGLLASRIVGVFKVPAIVVAFREDGTAVGSVRSFNGFKISSLLAACSDFFIDYGGHDSAAGFSLRLSDWEVFSEKAKAYMDAAEITIAEETIVIDAELPHSYLKPELKKTCEFFEPFGEENRSLVFLARDVPMVDAQIVGKAAKSHLKLTLDFGQYKWPALLWDGAERLERDFSFKARDRLDLLFKVTTNRWNGEEKPQLELYDLRRTCPD
ncbi:MAG: single-stranded-DNA-specific exonuclease RecJ [Spirochaetes bacterium]|nr:single-stranded-DNA-specific exonuclease RecJ [Spirochaetota bacterium]